MIVITSKYGELGNRLITFSNLIAFSANHRCSTMNLAFSEYAEYFVGTSRDIFCRYPDRISCFKPTRFLRHAIWPFDKNHRVVMVCAVLGNVIETGWKKRFYLRDLEHVSKVEAMKSGKLTFVSGLYILDPTSVREHSVEIRRYFSLVPTYQHRVDLIMQRLREECEVIVGVHYRQGDYKHFRDGIYYYSDDEYRQEMLNLQALFPSKKVGFLITSNEPHRIESSEFMKVYEGGGHLIEDLYCLAACDYIMGPPSTFSLWASFYGNTPRYVMNRKEKLMHGIDDNILSLSDLCTYIPSAPETNTIEKLQAIEKK